MKRPLVRFRERLKALNRRADFLDQRIASYQGNSPSHDKAELAALRWAIRIIENDPDKALLLVKTEAPRGEKEE